jgi:hypothetical protein
MEERVMNRQAGFTNRAIECERIAGTAPNVHTRRLFRALALAWRGETIVPRIEIAADASAESRNGVQH